MSDLEKARAQKEPADAASKATASANRARLWAGLNRYLASEAEQARKAASRERAAIGHARQARRDRKRREAGEPGEPAEHEDQDQA